MSNADASFAGSIPNIYDRQLGPLLFRPYAAEMARRVAALRPARILETAAGTGLLTEEVLCAVPGAQIVATDLNQAMLDVAAGRLGDRITIKQADALDLPFEDGAFDMVMCQFGVMFYPDKVQGHREARRVLSQGGHYLVAIWDRLESNPVAEAVQNALESLLSESPPQFLRRAPYGYTDPQQIRADLAAAGFDAIRVETVEAQSLPVDARSAAVGLVQGSPVRSEVEAIDPQRLEAVTDGVAAALAPFERNGHIDAPMSALLVTATR